MLLNFHIDWGSWYLYSRRHYHPVFRWSGRLECSGGEIKEIFRYEYPVIWFGPGHCPNETKLERPEWESTTKRKISGIRVTAESGENTRFRLVTESGTFEFTAAQIRRDGRIDFPVGPKYLNNHVQVTRDGFYWFQPKAIPGAVILNADQLSGAPIREWARMRCAWIDPGKSVRFTAEVPPSSADFRESVLHIAAMAAPAYTPGNEKQVHDEFTVELFCDGKKVAESTKFYREHDLFMQLLEDDWLRFRVPEGTHEFELCNTHPKYSLLINRAVLSLSERNHLQLSLPEWALCGEKIIGKVFAVRKDTAEIEWPGGSVEKELVPGWNEFEFTLSEPGIDVKVFCGESSGTISAVYALSEEAPPVTVGYDMTVVPHDSNGFMDWLLDYTWRTRLGNLVVFRSFLYKVPDAHELRPVDPELLKRWAEYCCGHGIHVEAATDFLGGAFAAAGAMLHSVGRHEFPGKVYAFDPKPPYESSDMKEASEKFIACLRTEIDKVHAIGQKAAFGDASGGHRYCYLAGVDFLRTETMVPHTQHLCSQARPAAESLGSGEWGVHIAIQHATQPHTPEHLGIYYLSLFQPWMMGASMLYEEDSLFEMFKEERFCWDDALTKGKRDMTRDFFRFAKTHPRCAHPDIRIAFLEGRYAAPFNGFICDCEQDPDYSVWGLFGNRSPEWGHRQPEKCRQILDVLMPGASTLPLRQDFNRRRYFFSGTPFGDFDEVPAEAKSDYLGRYSLLLNLGWNTMIPEDYAKLKKFVADGGTLFTGLPEFSTHVKRDFLKDMTDLALWNGGDLSELCGVRVKGRSEAVYKGQWNAADRASWPEPHLSSIPSRSPEEDGPCRLAEVESAGASVEAWDSDTGTPLVWKFRYGKGTVYLLAAWAYPGHEVLQKLSASLTMRLASEACGDCRVDDPSGEVFWNVRTEEHCRVMMLLNTDWSTPGNEKRVTVHTPGITAELRVKERHALFLIVLPHRIVAYGPELHFETVSAIDGFAHFRIYGSGEAAFDLYTRRGVEHHKLDFFHSTCIDMEV